MSPAEKAKLALVLRRQRQRLLRQPVEPDPAPEPTPEEISYQLWQKNKSEELLERELGSWERFKDSVIKGVIPKVTTR